MRSTVYSPPLYNLLTPCVDLLMLLLLACFCRRGGKELISSIVACATCTGMIRKSEEDLDSVWVGASASAAPPALQICHVCHFAQLKLLLIVNSSVLRQVPLSAVLPPFFLCRCCCPDVDGASCPGGGRQPCRPRRHLQAPPQLQIPSDDGGQREEGAGGAEPGPERAHDHHGLLHAGDERVRAAEAGQGVGGAAGHPRGDHVVGELAGQDPAVPRRGRRGVPHQARPTLRPLPPLQPPLLNAD